MTFDEYIKKYTNVGIDVDNYPAGNLFQCMDNMHKYMQDVLGLADLSLLAQPDAKSVYLNFPSVKGHELFDKIDNTPTGVPLKGDIVFWGTGLGQYGHVAIMVQGDVNSFRSFDQNFPTGSVCHVQNHPNYLGVLGWLRLKPPIPMVTITQAELDAIRKARDDNYNGWQAEKTKNVQLTTYLTTANDELTTLKLKLASINTIASKFHWFHRADFKQIKDLTAV